MAISASVKAAILAAKTLTGDLGSGKFDVNSNVYQAFTDGAGIGAVNVLFADTRTLGASAAEDLDVATGGGLVDVTGAAVAMARVKVILIKASASNTNDVVLSRAAANGVPIFAAASDAISIRPGGCFLLMAVDATGYVVTAATADLIHLANSAGTTGVTYDIVILGASS